ncbi:MAG: type IV pilus assembly protein PilM [Phycisphaerae bacterium]|nr:type IV pilus assembly protein PilM [Phycisphaerae bacterium]
MASNVCWGIELGACEIKAIKLERSGEGVTVLEYVVIPHKLVLSSPEVDAKEAMRVALGELVAQHNLTGSAVAVSVPGHSAFARFAKLPPVEPKKVPDIVKFEAVQQIPFPIDDVEWDYQTFANPDSPEVEVGIFAITRERVMEKLALWSDVGITPDHLTISPLAAYNAIAFDLAFTEKTPGTVIVDVGTTSTDLIVAEAGRVWIRTFPIGGHQFTEALVGAFKLTYPKAERLKREAEQSKHARHVLQAMRPVFGDLCQDIQRSIGYYQSLHRDAKLTRLIGLGSTFQLPGLRKFLSQQLQMEVMRPEQFQRATVDDARAEDFKARAVNLCVAYGLALQGLDLQTVSANLMPVSVVREAVWSRKTKWFAAAAGIALAAGAVSFIKPMADRSALAGLVKPTVIDQAKNELKRLRGEWTKVEGEYKPDPRAGAIGLLLERRDIYPHLVSDLSGMLEDARVKLGDTAGEGKSFVFGKWDTRYVRPAGASAGEEQPQEGGEQNNAAPPKGPKFEFGKVQLTLEVQTTAANAEKAVAETIQKWLFDHADRKGVPYTIHQDSVLFKVKNKTLVADKGGPGAAGATASAASATPPEITPAGTGEPGRRRGGRPTQGGGEHGRPSNVFGENDPGGEVSDRPHGELIVVNIGDGPSGGPGVPVTNAKLEELAPLPAPPTLGKPGETVTVIEVTWEAILRGPAGDDKKADGGEKKTDKKNG